MDQLIKDFREAVQTLSFYQAAEGEQRKREYAERRQAELRLHALKRQLLDTYGKAEVVRIINSLGEHLCFTELLLD